MSVDVRFVPDDGLPAGFDGRLLLLEDDGDYLRALQGYFRAHFVTRTAATLAQARMLLTTQRFSGAILDVQLEDGCGLDLLAELRGQGLTFPVLVLTGHFIPPNAAAAQLHGAEFLPKGLAEAEHFEAFARRVREHESSERAKAAAVIARYADAHRFTQRECEIIELAIADVPRSEMESKLGISHDTVKSHVRKLLQKTGHRTLHDLSSELRRLMRGDAADDAPERAG